MLRLTTVTRAASPQTKSTLDRDPVHTFLTCTSYLRSTVWNIGISTPLSVRTRHSLLHSFLEKMHRANFAGNSPLTVPTRTAPTCSANCSVPVVTRGKRISSV